MVRRNRRWFVPLLSLAFLFAQLGMVVHASTHLKSDRDKAPAQFCGQCLSSAPLQNMVGGGAVILPTVEIPHDHLIETVIRTDAPRGTFTAFRSRAPPQHF